MRMSHALKWSCVCITGKSLKFTCFQVKNTFVILHNIMASGVLVVRKIIKRANESFLQGIKSSSA